jgi:hypothetical protein
VGDIMTIFTFIKLFITITSCGIFIFSKTKMEAKGDQTKAKTKIENIHYVKNKISYF